MFCISCGANIPTESQFCFKCGASLIKLAEITGEGGHVETLAPPQTEAPTLAKQDVEAKYISHLASVTDREREESVMFCRHCGINIPDGSHFCLKCGISVETAMRPSRGYYKEGAATEPLLEEMRGPATPSNIGQSRQEEKPTCETGVVEPGPSSLEYANAGKQEPDLSKGIHHWRGMFGTLFWAATSCAIVGVIFGLTLVVNGLQSRAALFETAICAIAVILCIASLLALSKKRKIPLWKLSVMVLTFVCGFFGIPFLIARLSKPLPDANTIASAVLKNNISAVQSFIDQGADLHILNKWRTKDGLTVMSLIPSVEMARLVLDHGIDTELRDSYDNTPLLAACMTGNTDIVRYLLARKVDVAAVSRSGVPLTDTTALDMAAMHGYAEIVRLLLKAGANPNVGFPRPSALGYAIANKHLDVVKLLLDAGVEVNWNILQMARDAGDKQIVRVVTAACMKGPNALDCSIR